MIPSYVIKFSPSASRTIGDGLPEKVATAALEFIFGPLADNPHRVGKQLHPPLFPAYSARRGEYRVIYRIFDEIVVVEIVSISHRRDAYRPTPSPKGLE